MGDDRGSRGGPCRARAEFFKPRSGPHEARIWAVDGEVLIDVKALERRQVNVDECSPVRSRLRAGPLQPVVS